MTTVAPPPLASRIVAAVGLTTAVAGALIAITLRIVDPVPAIPDAFGFSDFALIGFEVMGVTFAAVGSLLVIRRPRNAIGWCMVVIGVGYGLGGASTAVTFSLSAIDAEWARGATRVAAWLTAFLTTLGGTLFAIGFIFPTGRGHTPRWDRFVRIIAVSWPLGLLLIVFQPGPLNIFPTIENPMGFGPDFRPLVGAQFSRIILLGLPVAVSVLVWSLTSRYRAAGITERQQLKWFALAIGVCVGAVSVAATWAVVSSDPPEAALALFGFAGALVPVAIGIAILRYRLYDIDRIVSRSLSYAMITSVLAGVFAATAIGLSTVLGSLAQGQTLAVATSTLLVLVLFGPLRRRAQSAIDRRFDRARYDASVTVQAMSARFRDDVDIDRVQADILGVVDRTFHPTRAGVWLRGAPR